MNAPSLARHYGRVVAAASILFCLVATPAAAQLAEEQSSAPSESESQATAQRRAGSAGARTSLRGLRRVGRQLRLRSFSPRRSLRPVALLASNDDFGGWYASSHEASRADVDENFSRTGFFATVDSENIEYRARRGTPAFDVDALSFTVGMDRRIASDRVIGAALNYVESDVDFGGPNGGQAYESLALAVLGSWYLLEHGFVDGILRYGEDSYDNFRQDSARRRVGSKADGEEWAASLGAGYDYSVNAWTISPHVRLNYSHLRIDSYREEGSPEALRYGSQNVEALYSDVGFDVIRAITAGKAVLLPQAGVEWIHEFKSDGERIRATPVNGGPPLRIPVDHYDQNYFRANLAATWLMREGRMIYLRVEKEYAQDDRRQLLLSLGLRLEL